MSTAPRPSLPPPKPPALLTFEDLVQDLTWPQLLKAAPLALRPTRVLLGMALAGTLALLVGVVDRLSRDGDSHKLLVHLAAIGEGVQSWRASWRNPGDSARQAFELLFASPWNFVQQMPVAAPVVILLGLAAWAFLGGAIARTAACDYAFNRSLSVLEALGFAVRKAGSLIGATLTPLVIMWGACLGVAILSQVLRVPWLNVIGGVFSFVAIGVSLVAAIVALVYVAGQSMLVPSIACEGSDSIDAMQRAYAFVLAKPLRLLAYCLVLLVQGLVLSVIVFTLIRLAQIIFVASASEWSGSGGVAVLGDAPGPSLPTDQRLARGAIGMWMFLLNAVGVGVMISYVWTAFTLLYLAMRRVCDGQDMNEIWTERMIPGTLGEMPGFLHTPRAGDAISDIGSADDS